MSDVLFPIRRDMVGNPIQSDIDMALRLGLNADGTARTEAQATAEADERQHVALVEAQRVATDPLPLPAQPRVNRDADIEIDGRMVSPNEIARRLVWSISLAEQQVGIQADDGKPLQERLDAILAAAAEKRIDPGLYKIVHGLAQVTSHHDER